MFLQSVTFTMPYEAVRLRSLYNSLKSYAILLKTFYSPAVYQSEISKHLSPGIKVLGSASILTAMTISLVIIT
jgi:hypothetical protein